MLTVAKTNPCHSNLQEWLTKSRAAEFKEPLWALMLFLFPSSDDKTTACQIPTDLVPQSFWRKCESIGEKALGAVGSRQLPAAKLAPHRQKKQQSIERQQAGDDEVSYPGSREMLECVKCLSLVVGRSLVVLLQPKAVLPLQEFPT
eukprot:5648368-Amphidinium_carterae.1